MKKVLQLLVSDDLINNIFNGSMVMMSVCLAIVTLFHVTDKDAIYMIDECFSVATGFYLVSMLLAYLVARTGKQSNIAPLADSAFLLATVTTAISCTVLIFEFYSNA